MKIYWSESSQDYLFDDSEFWNCFSAFDDEDYYWYSVLLLSKEHLEFICEVK